MGDGPEGAALLRGERRIGLKKLRHEPVQGLHDGGGHRLRKAVPE
jgi:hypothetical protein